MTLRLASSGALLVALLAGCASGPPRADAPLPGSVVATPARPADNALASEQRWLGRLFADTPVQIALQRDGVLGVEVPLDFSFDAGSARVKPPLAKVLDYVAQSATRQISVRLHVAAPTDARGGAAALALRRAAAVRAYLVGRGVSPQRFSEPAAAERANVVLRLEPPPA